MIVTQQFYYVTVLSPDRVHSASSNRHSTSEVSPYRHKTPIAASFRDSQYFEVLGDKMFRKKDPKGKE